MASIRIGEPAPTFSALAHNGQQVSLASFHGRHAVVLYFYPMDGTLVCTWEARAFRDAHDEFIRAGAVVVGVSRDGEHRHRNFASDCQLPFLLLSDPDEALHQAFGVQRWWGLLPGRVTFVIDREGIVRHIVNSQLFARRHVTEALEVVRQLPRSGTPESTDPPPRPGA